MSRPAWSYAISRWHRSAFNAAVHAASLRLPHKREVSEDCDVEYSISRCQCDGRKGVKEQKMRCNKRDCLTCYSRVRRRNGERVREKFDWAGQGIGYIVFTVPEHLRTQFADRKRWGAVRRAAWGIVRDVLGAEFGFEATHPRGDCENCGDMECEGCGDLPQAFHPHLNFLFAKHRDARYEVSKGRLTLVKRLWALLIGYEHVPQVRYRFALPGTEKYKLKTKGKANWCEYVPRPFPGWTWWTGNTSWYGNYPRRDWVETTPVEVDIKEGKRKGEKRTIRKPVRDKGYHMAMKPVGLAVVFAGRPRPEVSYATERPARQAGEPRRILTTHPLGVPSLCADCQCHWFYRGTVTREEYDTYQQLEGMRTAKDPPWWDSQWRGAGGRKKPAADLVGVD